MTRNEQNRWAKDWFAGNAQCPTCKDDSSIHTVRTNCSGASIIDTWACKCGHRRKVEFREAAVLANADAEVEWIERAVAEAPARDAH